MSVSLLPMTTKPISGVVSEVLTMTVLTLRAVPFTEKFAMLVTEANAGATVIRTRIKVMSAVN